jgi:hypothetical protein
MPVTNVAPGDLITAEQYNGIVAALLALDARLKILEAKSAQTTPPTTSSQKVHDILQGYVVAVEANKADKAKLKDITAEMARRFIPPGDLVKFLEDHDVEQDVIVDVIKELPSAPDTEIMQTGTLEQQILIAQVTQQVFNAMQTQGAFGLGSGAMTGGFGLAGGTATTGGFAGMG